MTQKCLIFVKNDPNFLRTQNFLGTSLLSFSTICRSEKEYRIWPTSPVSLLSKIRVCLSTRYLAGHGIPISPGLVQELCSQVFCNVFSQINTVFLRNIVQLWSSSTPDIWSSNARQYSDHECWAVTNTLVQPTVASQYTWYSADHQSTNSLLGRILLLY